MRTAYIDLLQPEYITTNQSRVTECYHNTTAIIFPQKKYRPLCRLTNKQK